MRRAWLGPIFRWAVWLDQWSMPDVFLLGSLVGYFRLEQNLQVTIDAGGYCYAAAAILTMICRASLDKRSVWRDIAPERTAAEGDTLSCTTCDLVLPPSFEGGSCSRCGAVVHARKPHSLGRTAALVVAAFVLFFPANLYPMSATTELGRRVPHTIFNGVSLLAQAGLWPLAVLIFCTSIAFPALKIGGLSWCLWSVRTGSRKHLVAKTKLIRLIDEIGRWSNADPFAIVFFVPLMSFSPLVSSSAASGSVAFILVVVLTMFASRTFDPRLMWDAAAGATP